MGWHGHLQLNYHREASGAAVRTVLQHRHDGPLRVLASLQPEAPIVCHNVLVHPPGGLVGGDTLRIDLQMAAASHALVTTPGATRFYRSNGAAAVQAVEARLAESARLEWLPLETIAFSGCEAENRLRFDLAPGAEMIGWDLLALGLPASDQGFERGRFAQSLELPGRWLERGVLDAQDRRLLDSPLGLAGHRVLATLWFAAGLALQPSRRDALLDAARSDGAHDPSRWTAGATAVHDGVVVLRLLADRVEPAMQRLVEVWSRWRQIGWSLAACAPRVWRT